MDINATKHCMIFDSNTMKVSDTTTNYYDRTPVNNIRFTYRYDSVAKYNKVYVDIEDLSSYLGFGQKIIRKYDTLLIDPSMNDSQSDYFVRGFFKGAFNGIKSNIDFITSPEQWRNVLDTLVILSRPNSPEAIELNASIAIAASEAYRGFEQMDSNQKAEKVRLWLRL